MSHSGEIGACKVARRACSPLEEYAHDRSLCLNISWLFLHSKATPPNLKGHLSVKTTCRYSKTCCRCPTAQAGRPKTITGFQTHTTPVLLSVGDRAELATNKYIPLSSVLEGIVILRENPNYVESSQD